jgi:hypothetical protein
MGRGDAVEGGCEQHDRCREPEDRPAEIVAEQLAQISVREPLLQRLPRLPERLVIGPVEHQ